MIFEDIWKNHNIVNKDIIKIFEVSEQLIYEMLYINWRILEIYQNNYKTFEIIMIDNYEIIMMI